MFVNFDFRSLSEYTFEVDADSPLMVSRQVLASVPVGGMPLLRINSLDTGVTLSSSKCAGVSALTGLSFRILNPFLPGITKGSGLAANTTGIQ
jgi:hypothetical protein